MWYIINSVQFKDNDILIIPYNPKWATYLYRNAKNVHYVDMTKRSISDGEVFNDMWHPSINGLRLYSKNLFEFLKENNFFVEKQLPNEEFTKLSMIKQYGIPKFADSTHVKNECEELLSDDNMQKLNSYLKKISVERQKIGAIVMNCNPFTLGHRYLIEYASSMVSHLYIFAVEENKSFFSFEDRFKLIQQGVSDLKNITVLPSDQFIISTLTFNDYFGKAEIQDKKIDPQLDVSIFGKYIAPALGINIRFAGAEPLDKITNQYNQTMAKVLPKYGVDFIEIPRKEMNGQVISASRVRALLKDKQFDEIHKIVPQTTYDYLLDRFNK